MRVSEGNLTQQYYCDYLTILAEEIFFTADDDAVRRKVHEKIVFYNLFLHRMSVDGGFHARVLAAVLQHSNDSRVLLDLLAVAVNTDGNVLPMEDLQPPQHGIATQQPVVSGEAAVSALQLWLRREYASSVKEKHVPRRMAVSALLRSYISGTNQTAEIIAAAGDARPKSWWQFQTRRITVTEISNPDMYFGKGHRPIWYEFPLDRYAAVLAGTPALPLQNVYDCVVCAAGAWFSSLPREEMIAWLNTPQPSTAEWEILCAPLLQCDCPDAALSTANWLYASGNCDPALDLYANITLAFPGTPAEILAFERIGMTLQKAGDFDNAFEAYKSAFLASRGSGAYQMAVGLKNLCEVGEDLGEDMSEYYTRIGELADALPTPDKLHLYLDLAASCRRRHVYEAEYHYLEQVVSGENGGEDLESTALSRLSEQNSCLAADGRPDVFLLATVDAAVESAAAAAQGNAAYFGFDPESALRWYGRSVSVDVSALQFKAAMAAGRNADEYAAAPAQRAAILAANGASPALIVQELNAAITDAWLKNMDISTVIEPVIPYLCSESLSAVLDGVTSRSTRDDERAAVCSAAARALLSAGSLDESRAILRTALRANPGCEMRSRLFAELGWMECEAGRYQAAADACSSALKINDQFPAAWAGRARALTGMGKYDEAFTAASFAVMQNPANLSYQHMRSALEIVSAVPVDPQIDLLLILPDLGSLKAAAAEYTVRKTSACPPDIWDVSAIEDVVSLRA